MHDTVYLTSILDDNWQEKFRLSHDPNKDTIWHKPASYYLEDRELSPLAYEFYYGYFKPSDNGATVELFKYVTTSNDKLRPFYRWCLEKSLEIADGAIWPYVSSPALQYSEKYPKEFLGYLGEDTSGRRFYLWTRGIGIGSIEEFSYSEMKKQAKELATTMKKNCIRCDSHTLAEIDRFAKACFE